MSLTFILPSATASIHFSYACFALLSHLITSSFLLAACGFIVIVSSDGIPIQTRDPPTRAASTDWDMACWAPEHS